MKRMLFNATHAEELRVAIVDGQKLIDIDIESAGHESRKSNIYKGVVTRVEPSLEACFVNYGEERHGFLPFKEISRTFFKPGVEASKARIQDVISEGTELLVQVDKEERGNKGAALTTYISLAGRYLVLMPNNPRGGGVSRRIEGEDRQELRETMDKLEMPAGMSIIARTAGIGRTAEELQWDLNYLLQLWRAVESAAGSASGAFLIYQESSLVIRAIRDYFTADIGEILIDTEDVCEQARQFMAHVMPDNVSRVKRYQDDVPLFSRFQIEHQIETAYSRLVPLPSGGAIVVDHTEALVAIDVNSARATRGSDIEETALRTNLEAADEAARQMRLRDLGGLIVIDFIDMESSKNQREVEQRLKDALHYDRARVQTGKISRFGLMELSRQRLRPALNEGTHITCPRCNGTGVIRDVESSALHVLRVIQEEAMKESTASVHAQVPVEVAAYLLNEKRAEIAKMEARLKVEVVLIPNKHLETPHYRLERLRHDDERLNTYRASYTIAEGPSDENTYIETKLAPVKPRQEAKVKGVTPDQPAPVAPTPAAAPVAAQAPSAAPAPAAAPQPGLIGRLLGFFRRSPANDAAASAARTTTAASATDTAEARPARGSGGRGRDEGRREGRGRNGERGREGRGRDGRGRDDRAREDRPGRGAQSPASGEEAARSAQEPRREREARPSAPNGEARSEGGRRGQRGGRRGEAPVAEATDVQSPTAGTPAGFTVVSADSLGVTSIPTATPVTPPVADAGRADLPETEGSESQSGEEGRRRRRRRGGRRGDRAERGATDTGTGTPESDQAAEAAAQTADLPAPVAMSGAVETAIAQSAEPPVAAPVEPAPAVTAIEAAVSATATTEPAPAPAPAPIAPAPEAVAAPTVVAEPAPLVTEPVSPAQAAPTATAAPTPVPVQTSSTLPQPEASASMAPAPEPVPTRAPASAPVDRAALDNALAGAGLQLVETRAAAGTFDEPAAAPAPRPVRQRRARTPVVSEPLMQVETDRNPGANA